MHFVTVTQIQLRRTPWKLFSETLNGRLPLKQGSIRPETLPKCVSDDSPHLIFRRRKQTRCSCWSVSNASFSCTFTMFLGIYVKADLATLHPSNRKKKSVSEMKDQVIAINSVKESSKSELSSGTFEHVKACNNSAVRCLKR